MCSGAAFVSVVCLMLIVDVEGFKNLSFAFEWMPALLNRWYEPFQNVGF